MSQQISVVFICLGNICRSPLAEGIFRNKVEQAGLGEKFRVDSAGTSAYHVGESPDPGSVRVARREGLDISGQRSRQLCKEDWLAFDYLIAMDSSNRNNTLVLAPQGVDTDEKLWLMRNFEQSAQGTGGAQGVPDPWGGGARGFEEVFRIVERSCDNLLAYLRHKHQL